MENFGVLWIVFVLLKYDFNNENVIVNNALCVSVLEDEIRLHIPKGREFSA